MYTNSILLLMLIFLGASATYGQQGGSQSAVVLDESLWVTFYDLPSRRFRAIRAAVLTGDTDSAARDLSLAAIYLPVEAERSSPIFRATLGDVVKDLRCMELDIETVTPDERDALLGRAYWLLAQHYLAFAREARDARHNRNASLYLWATTHHT